MGDCVLLHACASCPAQSFIQADSSLSHTGLCLYKASTSMSGLHSIEGLRQPGLRHTWLARRTWEGRLERCMSPDMRLVIDCRLCSTALLWDASPSSVFLGRPKIDSLLSCMCQMQVLHGGSCRIT